MKKLSTLAVLISLVALAGIHWTTLPSVASASSGDAAAGLEVQKKSCLRCHGAEGKGDGPAAKLMKTKPTDWTNREPMSKLSDDYLVTIITKGGDSVGKSKLMPAFGDKLSETEVHDVIAFIRSLSK